MCLLLFTVYVNCDSLAGSYVRLSVGLFNQGDFDVIDLFTGNKLMFIGIIFLHFGSINNAMSYYNDLKRLMTIFVQFQTTQIMSLIPRNSPTDRLMYFPK